MANENNLNPPWEKGQSGNPKGKPKGARNRSTIVRELLEKTMLKERDLETGEETGNMIPATDALVVAQVLKARAGDTFAFKELMDSGFGKIADKSAVVHSFKQMGRVTMGDTPQGVPQIGGPTVDKALTFDVGADPAAEEPEEDEDEDGFRDREEGDE